MIQQETSVHETYDYNEEVTLLRADYPPRTMSLAAAVREIMSFDNKLDRMRAEIVRDG